IMDKQQYQNIIQYLANFTYPENCDTFKWKQIQRLSTYYIVKNSQLYKPTKEGLKRVITQEQVE
ncbi:14862_t:CDS:1, partial [Funneliformis mosseae]